LPSASHRWPSRVKIPLITNGGGLNPLSAAEVTRAATERLALHGLKLAVTTGDNLLPRLAELRATGDLFANIETGQPLRLNVRSLSLQCASRRVHGSRLALFLLDIEPRAEILDTMATDE